MVSQFHLLPQTFAITFYVLVCIFVSVEPAITSTVTDKEALISFKSGVSLPPSYWDQNSSLCTNWTGDVCNKLGNRVVALQLSGLGLAGSISPHIGNLSFLRSLHLQNNKLIGNIPSQFLHLFRLKSLNLSSNTIQGPLPSNMTQLIALQTLDLASNNITGTLPENLSRLKNLQVLNLARNNLHGPIPSSISNLSSTLTHLNLGTNSLSGRIPSELGFLYKLKELDLAVNQLTGTVALSIYNISSLVLFTVASNQLWGEIPSNIGHTLPNLLYFRTCINQFTGKIPASLHNISGIRSIRLANNLFEGSVPPGLGNLQFLERYNIGFNQILSYGDDGLSFLTSLTNNTRLQFLGIDDNNLEGVIPESIGNLSGVIEKLYMGGNHIYGHIPSSIGHLSSLTLLKVSYNLISGAIPPEIGQLKDLQMLGLAANKMSVHIPNSLGKLRMLNNIDLSGNYFVGNIPPSFPNFQKLLSMDLSNNLLNGSISREIFLSLPIPSLSTILNLSNNFLSGTLPEEIGLLGTVVTIDLSDNRFSGSIPSSIGKCSSLVGLFMVRNTLSGPLPNALGEMKGLEILDLSSNQLSGSIPDTLKDLRVLRYLNLSFNLLEGVIPNGGIFVKNISSVYLEGNPKLCLHFPCVESAASSHRRKVLVSVTTILGILAVCIMGGCLLYVRKSKARVAATSDLVVKGAASNGCLREGIEVAVKVLDIRKTASLKSFLAECEALRSTRHRNLVKLITSCSSIDFKNMEFLASVYEYLSNGSLEDWIKGKRKNANGDGLNIVDRLNVAIDVACGLDYLHHDCEVAVAHCDLKPSNILLDRDMTAKIGDFGLAKLLIERTGNNDLSSTNVLKGSIGYMPPEYGFGQKPSTAGDAYSFAVVLLELFTGKSPTHENFTGDQNLIRWVQSAFPENIVQVLDSELLHLMQHLPNEGQINIIPEAERNCLISIMEVGISCTCASPDGRIGLRDALCKLETARQTLFEHTHV
ncbi:unnamed protein product [Prunus armeniaca]|uniref:non-specific serine/threonine protein kinase n=1 Tax=Prunus armeniaca TaxID=36596 RepID=A0A6J5TV32_PRUAR|nr:unnamed protein product [Prunus armeniaca]